MVISLWPQCQPNQMCEKQGTSCSKNMYPRFSLNVPLDTHKAIMGKNQSLLFKTKPTLRLSMGIIPPPRPFTTPHLDNVQKQNCSLPGMAFLTDSDQRRDVKLSETLLSPPSILQSPALLPRTCWMALWTAFAPQLPSSASSKPSGPPSARWKQLHQQPAPVTPRPWWRV